MSLGTNVHEKSAVIDREKRREEDSNAGIKMTHPPVFGTNNLTFESVFGNVVLDEFFSFHFYIELTDLRFEGKVEQCPKACCPSDTVKKR